MEVALHGYRRDHSQGTIAFSSRLVSIAGPFLMTILYRLCLALLVVLALGSGGCTRGTKDSSGNKLDPMPLSSPLRDLEKVEDLSETVANRLIEFSDAVRKRDYRKAGEYLVGDFLGTRLADLPPKRVEALVLGVERTHLDADAARKDPVNRSGFLGSLEKLLTELELIDYVFFKTRGAEFETEDGRGVLRMTANIIGRSAGNKPFSLYGWAEAEVVHRDEVWLLRRFVLNRLQITRRGSPIFSDVAAVAGLAELGPRIGTGRNSSFYWRGAVTADVDGDGLHDIFSSTSDRVFLYRNLGDGTFENIAERAGLDMPPGVTGPLFFDYDRDGDQDLFCGYVGWRADGVPYGESLRLYRNEGRARFTDVTEDVGLGDYHVSAFSACAADVDNDGWLDLYVCNYNRLEAVYPNSWYRATNGTPNVLFHNRKAKFVEIAADASVAGSDWSYAAAFADFDEDGDQDLYVANDYGDNCLYENRGELNFVNRAADLGVLDTGNGMGAAWGDLDNDGRLDLYVSNMSSSAGNRILNRLPAEKQASSSSREGSARRSEGSSPRGGKSAVRQTLAKLAAGNTIFRQSGGGFEKLPASQGGVSASWAWSASLLDIDLDGTQDIYVSNGFISGDSLKDT